jgi:DNA polymerase
MASDALRGLIVAGEGRKLVQADFANIEGRLVAWYSNAEWKLQAFMEFDADVGPDLYNVAYAKAFGVPVDSVTSDQRQIGKVIELAGGYQGWVGACATFAAVYRIEGVPEETYAQWMGGWRNSNPDTVALWASLQDTARRAIRNPGKVFPVAGRLQMLRTGPWLRIRLPSGRQLCYPCVGIDAEGSIHYMGQNQYTRKWSKLYTYGGKLLENIVQGTAADLLWHASIQAEQAGYPVVLRVHDELITEPMDSGAYTVGGLAALMRDAPAWADGLPIAAAGFEAYRYRKD